VTVRTVQLDGEVNEPSAAAPAAWSPATWFAVLSMAATSFALVSAEFLPAGLLTPMARDLGISEGTAGQVVTATASVGAVMAILSNVLIGRLNRKTVLVGLSALAIGSNILAAVASDFWLILLGRAGLGVALSGFWALSFAVVARLVGTNATGRGMAIVTLGVSLATIAAPSMGALISDWLGWRSAMAMTAGLAAVAMVLQWLSLPTLPATTSNSLSDVLRLTRRRGIQLGMLVILLLMTGHFAGSVYLRPFLEQVTQLATGPIALALLGFGIAAVIGNVVGGRMSDANIRAAVTTTAALLAFAALALVLWGVHIPVAFGFVALWGLAFGMAPVVLPNNLSRAAPDALEAAGSLMITSFQVAITIGAIVGGYVVDTYGATGPLTLTAILAASTLVLVLLPAASRTTPAASRTTPAASRPTPASWPTRPIRLYRIASSGHCHRVELLLSLLGLPYELVDIDTASRAHKSPEFLARNAFGQVPVIEDGDVTLADSNAILVYLENRYAPGQWLPRDPVQAAAVQRWLSVAAGQLAYGLHLARVITLFKRTADPAEPIARGKALVEVMEGELQARPFLTGDRATLADLANYAYVALAPEGNVTLQPYPAIRAWLARIEALPGFVPMKRAAVTLAD
jgi:DHA1 family purine ribonucleoside efflux pump-like MFS transporter